MTTTSHTKNNTSQISLILANIIPLFGVFFWGWDVATIIFLYWFENIVIGFYNIFRMKKAAQHATHMEINKENIVVKTEKDRNKIKTVTYTFLIPFFIIHFGIFSLVHGIFVFTMFGIPNMTAISLLIAIGSLFVSHGISYSRNYIGNQEYMKTNPAIQMFKPYKRIMIMHFTILLSGFVLLSIGTPIWSLIILILIKIGVDWNLHMKSHTSWLGEQK
ncbi:hypothetical protein HOF40_01220 [Candidatus Parcubacteria bacterium]|jgi:hypothetical protein|nr:hypothetical protein [Candidatus Parcubacteria bacterium]MBT3948687.1 hypothetical protein [Candidatus Parcubacteria bacterium]